MDRPPEEICWGQSTDSLVLSESLVGPSTNTSHRHISDLEYVASRGGDRRGDDEKPLAGEFISEDDEIVGREDMSNHKNSPYSGFHMNGSVVPRDRELQGERSSLFFDYETGEDRHHANDTGQTPGSATMDHSYSEGVSNEGSREHPLFQRPEAVQEIANASDEHVWVEDDGDFAPEWDRGQPLCRDDVNTRRDSWRGSESQAARRPSSQYDRHQEASISGPESKVGFGDEASDVSLVEQPPSRYDHRRARSSLVRERQRLDRLPRSQRLSEVKGHPLGGMTLLELEEKNLVDVGIGEMTRLLAQRGNRAPQRSDADLLRRSARLLRRAQKERKIPPTPAGNQRGEPIPDAPTKGKKRPATRRPASASRDPHTWDPRGNPNLVKGAGGRRPGGVNFREGVRGPDLQVGLYSGGGARCRLVHKRPLSAKPALTCGSGWHPGRRRPRRGPSGHHKANGAPGTEYGGQSTSAVRGSLDSGSSDVSDLSLHGIVEYDDEEEGPFK